MRRHRPERDWQTVTDMVNGALPRDARTWTPERLKRAVKRFVSEGMLDARVLNRAPVKPASDRLMVIVASIAGAEPRPTLKLIADSLQQMRERTPRGSAHWSPSSVKMLVDRAREHGLLGD